MSGVAKPNFNSQGRSATAQTERNAEYAGTPFTDTVGTTYDAYKGMNNAAANAPGIGIATGFVDPKLEDWSLLDQDEAARDPQQTGLIGHIDAAVVPVYDGATPGFTPATVDVQVREASEAIADPVGFAVADTAAVDGAVADTVSGILNETGATIAIGDRLWGPIP